MLHKRPLRAFFFAENLIHHNMITHTSFSMLCVNYTCYVSGMDMYVALKYQLNKISWWV